MRAFLRKFFFSFSFLSLPASFFCFLSCFLIFISLCFFFLSLSPSPLSLFLLLLFFFLPAFSSEHSIRNSMDQPERFNGMLNVSYAVCFTVYASVASLGYLMYGTSTAKEITLNIMGDEKSSDLVKVIARIATCLIVINPITKFGLTMNPVSLMVEEVVLSEEDIRSWKTTLCSMAIRIMLSAACVAAAISLPFFARVVGFIGAFCSCFVSIVFPTAAALVLLKGEMSSFEYMFCWSVLIFGIVCTAWGTIAVFASPI